MKRPAAEPTAVEPPCSALRHGAFALLVIWLSACAPARLTTSRAVPATLPTVGQLEAALQQRRDAVQSLRALSRLHYRDTQESGSARQAIIVARPDLVRVEVFSVFGAAFVLTADSHQLAAFVPGEGTLYRGVASPENLWRYTRLWMPVEDLVDIVLGTPGIPRQRQAGVSYDAAQSSIRLQYDLNPGTQSIWFSDALVPVAAEQRGSDDQVEWHATYSEFRNQEPQPIATQIGLELPAWSRSIELTLQDIDINPSLDRSLFALQTPPGVKVIHIDSAAD